LAFHQLAISSTFYFHQLAISLACYFVNLLFHQIAISSTCHFLNLAFHQLAISSTWHFINFPFHQVTISLAFCFDNHLTDLIYLVIVIKGRLINFYSTNNLINIRSNLLSFLLSVTFTI